MLNRIICTFIVVFTSLGLMSQGDSDQKLMQVGNSKINVSEFKYIYEKNNGSSADYSQKSLADYVELYTRFKLKVEKAKMLQLDTISALKAELAGYRKQLASSYLLDKEVTEFLLMELYDRMKTDVSFSHIFIPIPEGSSATIINDAKNTLRTAKSKIIAGMTFEEAASQFSQDKTTSSKGGNMGFFTAKLPSGFYNLESALYQLPLGQVSDIVESKIGFHLIKVLERRPARGFIEVSHILLKQDQKNLADSLYQLLLSGQDFDVLALNYSIDKTTSKNGGKLPAFGISTYERSFEDAAFGLQKDGDVSAPILTKSGWHLIKRISKPLPDKYETFIRKMKAQISKDQRFDAAKFKLISDIKQAAGYTENKSELVRFAATLDEDFYSYKWTPNENVSTNVLFSLGGSTNYTVKDFANYCKKNTKTRLKNDKSKPLAETTEELFAEFVNESAMDFEEKSLEVKYPDFKSLMREYEEGILLFEATKINVWDKANQDSVGLEKFYKTVEKNYIWDEKAKISEVKINSADKKLVDKIYKFAAKNEVSKLLEKFNGKSKVVEVKEVQIDKSSKEAKDITWQVGTITALQSDKTGSTYSFNKLVEIVPSRLKTLAEARGYVVADYQDYLEKEWMKQLSEEIKVTIDQDVLNSLKR